MVCEADDITREWGKYLHSEREKIKSCFHFSLNTNIHKLGPPVGKNGPISVTFSFSATCKTPTELTWLLLVYSAAEELLPATFHKGRFHRPSQNS